MNRGAFIVFEGIDGCGKSTQIGLLANRIRALDKYQDVLLSREPTYRATRIINALTQDSDPFSNARLLADLFIEDRYVHWLAQLKPAKDFGATVLEDRYSMSTCAFQSTQGLDRNKLLEAHLQKGIGVPDLTCLIDVPVEVAIERMVARGGRPEKFEKDIAFMRKLRQTYLELAHETTYADSLARKALGEVVVIDGNSKIPEIETDIWVHFCQKIRAR